MKAFLDTLSRGESLAESEAHRAMHRMMEGEADERQVAALLMGLRARGETLDELTGFTRAMRERSVRVRCDEPHAIDLCGTGGDASGTFNISTAASFVCAGAGVTVAKHGNRSVSSKCGSADVLSALGVAIDLGPQGVEACLRQAGIAFIFARRFHPAMRHVAGVRRALGVRTCFNILGPLCNPAGVKRQIVGAFSIDAAERMAAILVRLGAEHVLTLSSADGLDEISLGAPTHGFEKTPGSLEIRPVEIHASDHGFPTAPMSALRGGTAGENAETIRALLAGRTGPHRDVVLVNAAYALHVSGRFGDIGDALEAAARSVDLGAAAERLARLVDVSREAAEA